MIAVSLQFNIVAPITLPKATVYVPPIGSPRVTYTPVLMSILGLLPGDAIATHFVNGSGIVVSSGFSIISSSTDAIVIENTSTSADLLIVSGYVIISRQVEPFKVYNSITDANGIVTIAHGLYYQPIKYVATASVGPNQEQITLCFISADATNASFQAFVDNSPYANSAISFSAQLI